MLQSAITVIEDAPLSETEQGDLLHHESRIAFALDQATAASVIIYTNLNEINKKRLYRSYGTFEDYCQERWNKGRQWGYQIIEAARVLDTFVSHGVHSLPENERQIRPLTGLEPAQQIEAWERAQELAEDEGRKMPTGRHVAQAAQEINNPARTLSGGLPFATSYSPEELERDLDDVLDPPMEPAQAADIRATNRPSRFNDGLRTSDSNEWYTPRHVIERVLHLFGEIDLDPCSNAKGMAATVPAGEHFTIVDDGLAQQWHGRVYMNPPYGDEIGQWTARLLQAYEAQEIDEAIALLPARTDTAWFRPLMAHRCCFVHGRLKFSGSENSAPFPSVIVYLGPDRENFVEYFGDIGTIMERTA